MALKIYWILIASTTISILDSYKLSHVNFIRNSRTKNFNTDRTGVLERFNFTNIPNDNPSEKDNKVQPFLDFEKKFKSVISGNRNQKIVLGCKVSGSPPPIIKWKFTKGSYSNNNEAETPNVQITRPKVFFDEKSIKTLLLNHALNTRSDIEGIDSRDGKDEEQDYMILTNVIPKTKRKISNVFYELSRLFPNARFKGTNNQRSRSIKYGKRDGYSILNKDEVIGEDLPIGLYLKNSDESDNNQLGLSITQSRIVIDCLDESYVGTYSCIATNGFKDIRQSTEIKINKSNKEEKECVNSKVANERFKPSENALVNNLLAKFTYDITSGAKREMTQSKEPARIYMWTANRVENQGANVRIFCRSTGNPSPKIGWLTPDGSVVKNGFKYKIHKNGDLEVRQINWQSDMGSYVCVSHNRYGTDYKNAFLYPVNNIDSQ